MLRVITLNLWGIEAPLDLGIMVEVPAAALTAAKLAEHADFFSIGTNDLTQYTMAAERGEERLSPLLTGPQPAVLRLIRATVEGAGPHPAVAVGREGVERGAPARLEDALVAPVDRDRGATDGGDPRIAGREVRMQVAPGREVVAVVTGREVEPDALHGDQPGPGETERLSS